MLPGHEIRYSKLERLEILSNFDFLISNLDFLPQGKKYGAERS